MRVGRTKLNAQSYTIGLSANSSCECLNPNQSTSHHLNVCSQIEHQTLYDRVKQLIPNFNTQLDLKKTDILLNGVSVNDAKFLSYQDKN